MAVEGIQERHRNGCPVKPCKCRRLSFRGTVWDRQSKRQLRGPWTQDKGEAEGWRVDMRRKMRAGEPVGAAAIDRTLDAAWEAWLADAEAGHIQPRSSTSVYKASSLSSYRSVWKKYVEPKLGSRRMSSVTHNELQAWADEMRDKGMARATIAGVFDPIKAVYRRAVEDDETGRVKDPVGKIRLPAGKRQPIEIAEPARAKQLVAALHDADRAIWATAFATGLRRSELRALRVSDLDFKAGVLIVSRAWTPAETKAREPKSNAGTRRVPIAGCAAELKAHLDREGRSGDDLVFGRTATEPFSPATVERHAKAAWKKAKLEPIGLHACRHSFASLCICQLGLNAVTVKTYMGHAKVATTLDIYTTLFADREPEHGDAIAAALGVAA